MDTNELTTQAKRIAVLARKRHNWAQMKGIKAQAAEFLRVYAGPHCTFYESVCNITATRESDAPAIAEILESFAEYIEAGLHQGLSPERKAQIDVVSDVLQQASTLLED